MTFNKKSRRERYEVRDDVVTRRGFYPRTQKQSTGLFLPVCGPDVLFESRRSDQK